MVGPPNANGNVGGDGHNRDFERRPLQDAIGRDSFLFGLPFDLVDLVGDGYELPDALGHVAQDLRGTHGASKANDSLASAPLRIDPGLLDDANLVAFVVLDEERPPGVEPRQVARVRRAVEDLDTPMTFDGFLGGKGQFDGPSVEIDGGAVDDEVAEQPRPRSRTMAWHRRNASLQG